MPNVIPGPGRLATLKRLLPVPFAKFPQFMSYLVRRHGNVAAFALPWRSYVFVNEPALIKDVFVTQQHAFSKSLGARVLGLLLGEGLLTSENPKHRQMRRIVQPAFHRERIARYMQVMEACADEFVCRLEPGQTFDAHAAMTELTLRIATLTLFGSDESAASEQVSNALMALMEEFPLILMPFGAILQKLPIPSTRRFNRARRELDEIVYAMIARRRADGVDRGDALSMLLAASDAETGERPDDEQIRDEVMTLFMAGHETTANALTWTLYLLAQNPQIDAKLGEAALAGDREYVMRVARESLRLYPPAWIIGREARTDVTLADGSFVPAGTTLFISPLVLHRRADTFPDPDRFDPDRWIGFEPPPFAYVPFGGGARRCIGEEFAWGELALLLAAFARAYRFERTSSEPVGTSPLVTLRPDGPVWMRALPRERASSAAAREAYQTAKGVS
jgi:cytochrome P450